LSTIDPVTGIGNAVGGMGDTIASIAFDSIGNLFGNGGSGGSFYDEFLSIDKTTGEVTRFLCPFLDTPETDFGWLAYNWDEEQMYFFGDVNDDTFMEKIDVNEPNCARDRIALNFYTEEIRDISYNTNDSTFYVLDNYSEPLLLYTVDNTGSEILINDDMNEGTWRGMTFLIDDVVIEDTEPPDIVVLTQEPITIFEGETFLPFEHVNCNDNIDGDITNNMDYSPTPDTSRRGIYNVDYQCIDFSDNQTDKTVQYIVKKISTGGGGSSSGTSGGTESSTPSLSNIPTLSFSPDEFVGETGSSISDLFSNLFSQRLDAETGETSILDSIQEQIQELRLPTEQSPSVSTPSPATSDRPSPVAEFFQNLFANFFG
jgi:hypothetical protein